MITISRKVKCPSCETMNFKEDAEQLKDKRYYCIPCAETKREETRKNTDGWDELFDYICELYDIDKPTGVMFAQIQRYRSNPDFNYTNTGMYLTLKYIYEILGREVNDDYGLGLIQYEYDNAKKHFIETKDIREYMEEFELNEEVRKIKIRPPSETFKKVKQLSFDNIENKEALDAEVD